MLIQRASLKPFSTELPAACYEIIKQMLADSGGPELFCHRLEVLSEMCGQTGKVEFSQFYEVLNICDLILQSAVERSSSRNNMMYIDCTNHLDNIVIAILKFTSVLFENTFFRSVYSSFPELVKLLDTIKPKILTHLLRLLVSISKTSRYIMQHTTAADQKLLSSKLMAIYECWDKCDSNTLAEFIKSDELAKDAKLPLKLNADNQNMETDNETLAQANARLYNYLCSVEDESNELDKITPMVQQRFNFYMDTLETRVFSVVHCLMSMSVVFYSRCLLEEWRISSVVKDSMIEQICELVQLEPSAFDENVASSVDTLRTESLKTLASIVFLEKNDKLQLIIDNLGLNHYLGYAANAMRHIVRKLKTGEEASESTAFITSLLSLIYHIAGFESGGSSLVNISTIPSLLDVVSLTSLADSLISFATRAVRIIDILTSLSYNEFISHQGIQIVVRRLVFEVDKCREFVEQNGQLTERHFVCHHHRSALIKSLLNFLKRAVVDSSYINHSRRIMDGDLPKALLHIFETSQYYGSSLVHCALELTTVFIYQEPAQLNTIQDSGVSKAILKLFFSRHFPLSREIVLSLPNICSALCLNERGLLIFNEQKPLIQIFHIIFSSGFIQVLRKRKNELVSAGGQLGVHFDEFMRHQPTLRRELIFALVTILDELIEKSKNNEINVSSKPSKSTDIESKTEQETADQPKPTAQDFTQTFSQWEDFSDDKLQDLRNEYEKSRRAHLVAEAIKNKQTSFDLIQEGNYLPLSDYMVLAIKMVEAILSNSTFTENSCAMIDAKLIEKLMSFFSTERIMPITNNPSYLNSLPSVFRLLLQQSRTVQTFVVLTQIVKEQLSSIELPDTSAELTAQGKVAELGRLSSLVTVFFNFLRMSLTTNAQDSRTIIFQYLSNDANGLKLIAEISEALQKFGKSVAHFNKEFREAVLSVSRKNTSSQLAPQLSVEITTSTSTGEGSGEATSSNQPKEESTTVPPAPPISSAYSLLSSIYKNLIEIVCQFGRSANPTRSRRIPENLLDTNKIAEELLSGVRKMLENVDYEGNWTFYVQNLLPMVRRLLCDENSIPYPQMLIGFVDTRCHTIFFEIGEKLLKVESFNTIGAPLLSWLSTLMCFLSVESISNSQSRSSRATTRDNKQIDEYLSLMQEDAVQGIGKIFDRLIDAYANQQDKKDSQTSSTAPNFDNFQLLEKVLDLFKELYQGIFFLHNKKKSLPDQSSESQAVAEIDNTNVEILIDMGFSNAQARQALSLYPTVDEAAEHLLATGAMAQADAHEETEPQQEQPEANPDNADQPMQEEGATQQETPASEDTTSAVKEVVKKQIDFTKAVNYLCDELIPKCLSLMEQEPSVVFSVADLLRVFVYSNEIKEWADSVLIRKTFVTDLNTTLAELAANFEQAPEAQVKKFASQIHLICLLWNGFDDVYINALRECNFYNNIINVVTQIIQTGKHSSTLLAPLILWLELYKKEYCLVKRRELFNESVDGAIQWHYWTNEDQHYGSSGTVRREFSSMHASEITSAFKAGKAECKVKIGDRQHVIDFVTMTQKQGDRSTASPVYGTVKLKGDFDAEKFVKAEQELHDCNDDSLKLVELIMQMLKSSGSNVDSQPELVFSLISLLHRLTLNDKSAQKFIELEGIETLVNLRCNKATALLTTVVSLILRNCCLNERLTAFSVDRLLRSLQNGVPISSSEQNNKTLPGRFQRSIKEWRRLFRMLTPFCDQNLNMYLETTRDMVSHKDLGEFQLKTSAPEQPTLEESDLKNLNRVLSVVTDELLQHIDNKTSTTDRVLKPNNLLLIVAELIRSYPQSANMILNLRHNEHLFLQLLLENIILDGKQTAEMSVSANSVFYSVMNANNTTECNETMVQIVRAGLKSVLQSVASKETELSKEDGKEYCQKLTTLTKFVGLLKDCNTPTTNSQDDSKRSFVHVVHDKSLLLEFIKAIRLIPLNQQQSGDTASAVFKFFEEFSRSIGMAKADIAAREFAANNEANAQPASDTNQPANAAANAQPDNNAPAEANPDQPPNNEQPNPLEGNAQQLMMDIFGESSADEQDDEEEAIHDHIEHIEFGNDQHNMEDDYEGDMHHEGPPRSRSTSSSSDSNDDDPDRTDALEQPDETVNHQQHANEEVAEELHGENANANLARNLEQLTNGLNNIDSALRRHQHAIRAIIETEDEQIEEDRETDDDVDMEDSTDEEVELETENETEEEEMQPAQNDNNFLSSGHYGLDIEMLPNESVEIHARDGGGLLQIHNGGAADARFFIPVEMQGADLANSLSLLTEYISGFYGARRNHGAANVVLNTIVRGGDSNDPLRSQGRLGGGSNGSDRSDNLHPLLRRPSRSIPVQATVTSSSHQRSSAHETLNVFLEDGSGHGSPFGPGSHAFIENAINAIGAWNSRSRGHRSHTTRHSHHHGLRRQNALRSRPLINNTRLLTFNGPSRILPRHFMDGHFSGPFSDDHELMNALQDPYSSFARRTVDSYIPFMLDRVAASTRLLNAHSVHYIGMVIAAHLAEVCRQKPEPIPPQIEPPVQQQPAEESPVEAAPLQDTERPTEDEARSVDEVSVDSSELTNRFANMDQEDEETTRDSNNEELNDGERTPQPMETESQQIPQQQMEVETPTIVQEESVQSTEQATEEASTSERPAEQPENAEDQPGPSGLQQPEEEGLDPAFLAALPDDIREEVIRDHQRQQRLNQLERRRREQSNSVAEGANNEDNPAAGEGNAQGEGNQQAEEDDSIDPEFLAALPPELQEEVLAQRQAQQAARNATANQNANANEPAADAIAFLETLNPTLRAQVLADADDSVLQILPENLAAEANRIRRDYEHEQLMRLASSGEHRNYAWRTENAYTASDNYMTSNPASIVQIFDQESVATISLFYFFNNDKFTFSRFQRVFKVIALHPGTCDFVLRSLLSILSAACNENSSSEENQGDLTRWSNLFKLHPTSNSSESILYVGKDNKIVVNKQFRNQVCTRVLETLGMLARQSAAHFFNSSLRFHALKETPASVTKPEGLEQFWKVVDKFDFNYKNLNETETKTLEPIAETSSIDIRQCPFGLLLELSTTPTIANSPVFLEKILRTFHSVLHIPATVTHTKSEIPLCVSDDTNDFLLSRLKQLIVSVMSTQTQEDSYREFRNFLVQLLYAFPSLRYSIFVILYDIVRSQGVKLAGMLKQLRQAFEDEEKMQTDETLKDSNKPGTSKEGESTETVRELPSLKVLSSKRNSPKQMLRSLNVVSFVRNQLVELYKRRRSTNDMSKHFTPEDAEREERLLHSVLDDLDELWNNLSFCLEKISHSKDNRAVSGLQSAAESFFLIHSLAISNLNNQQTTSTETQAEPQAEGQPAEQQTTSSTVQATESQPTPTTESKKTDDRFTKKVLEFAGKHRVILNQILRENTNTLESMMTVLSQFPTILEFDVKRKYFYREIKKIEGRSRMHDDIVVRIRRSHLFSDAYRELFRLRPTDWKQRFYIVFEGEEGQDAGGLLREFFSVITREIFNPNYALFSTMDGVTYAINLSSFVNPEHLFYFKFAGHIIAKAIYDQKQLDCYFTRALYKQILNLPVNYTDLESFDNDYYKNLMFLLENPIETAGVELNFNLEVEEFGVRSWRELKEGGNHIPVTDENKEEYIRLVCHEKLTSAVKMQLDAFLKGFYEIIPRQLISVFNEQELELLISGLPEIDIDDLAANTELKQYTKTSPQVQWLFRALREFEAADKAKFLQFVFGSSKVPLNGFAELQGMNGIQKFTIQKDTRATNRLPASHTCFNQLDLPVYESYEKLKEMILKAIRECTTFGLV